MFRERIVWGTKFRQTQNKILSLWSYKKLKALQKRRVERVFIALKR